MSDDATKQLLLAWNLGHLIERFKRNEVNEKVLREMTPDIAETLIPNIVERVAFLKARAVQFGSLEILTNPPTPVVDEENLENLDNHQLQRQNCFHSQTTFFIQSFNVLKALQDDPDGKLVLTSYFKHKKPLNGYSRKIIVDTVLRAVQRQVPRLQNDSFKALALKICEIFKSERLIIYYEPPVALASSPTGQSIGCRGRLAVRYGNLRQQKKALGLDDSKKVQQKEKIVVDENVHVSKKWLDCNESPWEKVIATWDATRELRSYELKNTTDGKVSSFVTSWPILKHPVAYQLIERDFSAMNLTEVELDRATWESFFDELMIIRPVNIRDSNAVSLSELLKLPDIDTNTRVTAQLLLLPHLIPPTKKVSKKWKPTISECADSILIHAQTEASIITIREQREKALKRFKQPLQPFVIVVGRELTKITDAYVCLDKIVYKVPSTLVAFGVCFKIFHVLDARFPIESHHLWCIVQEGLYHMKPEADSKSAEVLCDLEAHRKLGQSTHEESTRDISMEDLQIPGNDLDLDCSGIMTALSDKDFDEVVKTLSTGEGSTS